MVTKCGVPSGSHVNQGLLTPDGSSGAQEIAKVAPAGAHVVKAFNTVFGHMLAQGNPLDTGHYFSAR